MVNSPLIRPYFLGGSLVGSTLNSHDENTATSDGFRPTSWDAFFSPTKTVVHHGIYPVTLSIDFKDFKKKVGVQ